MSGTFRKVISWKDWQAAAAIWGLLLGGTLGIILIYEASWEMWATMSFLYIFFWVAFIVMFKEEE